MLNKDDAKKQWAGLTKKMKHVIADTELAAVSAGLDEDDEEARIPIFSSHS